MAGAAVPAGFDGVSVLPYARPAPPAPRIATFIEYVGEGGGSYGNISVCGRTVGQLSITCNSAGNYDEPPLFNGTDFCLCQDALNNTYTCIRVVAGVNAAAEKATMLDAAGAKAPAAAGATDYRYCEFSDERLTEFFDYTTDPYELTNTAATMDGNLRAALAARLAALRGCHGAAECTPLLTEPIA